MNISKLTDSQFAILFSRIAEKIKDDPIESFIKAAGFLDLTPTPAQEVVLKIVFGKDLDPITKKTVRIEAKTIDGNFALVNVAMTEYEIYEFLTERKYDSTASHNIKINKIDLICGRRSGKTLLSAAISIYCAISNNWTPFLKKTPFATVLIMSHSKEFSEEVLEQIRSLIEGSEVLIRLKNKDKKNTAATMNLRVPWVKPNNNIEYSRVQIKVAAASSKTTRGVAACAILCDEIAHWLLDENMKETDVKIMKAVRPAMKQFGEKGLLIKLSSPAIKRGILYEEYKQYRQGALPSTYAVFKAPTWMMTPIDVVPDSEFLEEWKLDSDGFDIEYRANFSDSMSNFILPEFIDMAVMKGVLFVTPEDGVKYKAAIDAAYKGDRFTFSVSGYANGRLKQYVSKGWQGTKTNPVSSFEVAEYIRNICKQYGIDLVAADQYSFQPLKEIFEKFNMTLEERVFTSTFKRKIYYNLKKLVHSQQIDLLDNEIQTKELKELVVEQSGTGNIRIGHPNGGSDDFSDSAAISAYLATEEISMAQFDFDSSFGRNEYGIKKDVDGRAFKAPSPDMLAESGHLSIQVEDNSSLFVKDPITGRLRPIDEEYDNDPKGEDGFQFDF